MRCRKMLMRCVEAFTAIRRGGRCSLICNFAQFWSTWGLKRGSLDLRLSYIELPYTECAAYHIHTLIVSWPMSSWNTSFNIVVGTMLYFYRVRICINSPIITQAISPPSSFYIVALHVYVCRLLCSILWLAKTSAHIQLTC